MKSEIVIVPNLGDVDTHQDNVGIILEEEEIFRILYASNVKRFNRNDSMAGPEHSNFASIINGQIKSRFSTKFLRENKNWLR